LRIVKISPISLNVAEYDNDDEDDDGEDDDGDKEDEK
jgi:hypothetical protein